MHHKRLSASSLAVIPESQSLWPQREPGGILAPEACGELRLSLGAQTDKVYVKNIRH